MDKISGSIENEIQKYRTLNEAWNNENIKFEVQGEKLTLKECYDRIVHYSDEIFERTKKITAEQIPENKYILYVNSSIWGTVGHPDIKYIDKQRLQKVYQAETGTPEINPKNFQENNMRRCLGFERDDSRFRVVNAFKDEMPTDLSDCVGIVFSGSEANILNEKFIERIEMTTRARNLVIQSHTKDEKIPKIGICFGGQLTANTLMGAEIGFVLDKDGNKSRVTGVNKVYKTKKGEENELLKDFPRKVFLVGQDHGQKIQKHTLPPNGEILAESENGEVELVYLEEANTLFMQFHPEAGSLRLDMSNSLNNGKIDQTELFNHNSDEIREMIFSAFIKLAGDYAKASMEKKKVS